MQLREIKTVISYHRYFQNLRGLLWAPPLDERYIMFFCFVFENVLFFYLLGCERIKEN